MVDDYKRARKIWESLDEKDRNMVSPRGNYVDSDKILYRHILNISNKDIGFVDIYKFSSFKNVGFIILAIKSEFRRRGYAKLLLDNAIEAAKEIGLKKLIYRCDAKNYPSIELAKNYGFVLTTKNDQYCSFYYKL